MSATYLSSQRGIPAIAMALSLGLAAIAAGGCGSDRVATAATESTREAAGVRAAKLPPLPVERLPSGDELIRIDSDLYFAFASAELTAPARSKLDAGLLARVRGFLGRPGTVVRLRGYTDGAGDRAYNLRLSLARARSVRRFLIAGGAPAGRLAARGFGEAQARSSRPDHSLRRVDVVLAKEGSR